MALDDLHVRIENAIKEAEQITQKAKEVISYNTKMLTLSKSHHYTNISYAMLLDSTTDDALIHKYYESMLSDNIEFLKKLTELK
jgi:hypothetical protein